MDTHKEELLKIKNDKGQTIVGILERNLPNESTRGAKIGIICHGVQAHKNFQFQPKLARRLPFDTFRFDFRGYGESDYISIDYSNTENDIEDIDTVVTYLEREYGYQLYAIISHSKGNISSYQYATKIRRNIPHLVAISARYNFNQILKSFTKDYLENFKKNGFITSEYRFHNEVKRIMTTFDSFVKFMSNDMSFVRNLPESTSVLIIHGEFDEYTQLKDPAMFANIIPNNTLKIIMGANHSFTKHSDELASSITEYFSDKFQSTKFLERNKYINKIPRYLNIEGAINVRDVGGYPCADIYDESPIKKYVRERFIFGSGNLTGITENGIKTLNLLNIQTVFDFRSIFEVQEIGFVNIPGIRRIHIPIFKDLNHSKEALFEKWSLYTQGHEGYTKACMMMLDEGRTSYIVVFQHILNYPRSPFIIHSSVGKDRVGVFCMLLLKLCGINDDIIAREYEVSNRNTHLEYEEDIIGTYYDICKGRFTIEEIRRMMNAKYESMILTLRKFKEVYGTVENYLNEYLGFTKQEINQIKKNLITDFVEYNTSNKFQLKSVL